MIPTSELVPLIQRERDRQAAASRLAAIAECARRCCTAPAGLLDRVARALRQAPQAC